jgi:hypothetical protein
MVQETTTINGTSSNWGNRKTYLFPPLSSLRSTVNSLNQGKMRYLMYSKHGFPSTIFGGQYAFFIFTFTSAYDIQIKRLKSKYLKTGYEKIKTKSQKKE